MDNMLKLILIGAGVIITCVVVTMGLILARESKTVSATGADQLGKLASELADSDLTKYDGEFAGSDVINAIGEQLGSYSSTESAPVYINVITSLANNTYTNNIYMDDIKNFSNLKYIKATAKFTGKIIRNANNVIIGIKFTQK